MKHSFNVKTGMSHRAQTRQGYLPHQGHLTLPWWETLMRPSGSWAHPAWTQGSTENPSLPSSAHPETPPPSPWMESCWVTLRAGKVPEVFPWGCTPRHGQKENTLVSHKQPLLLFSVVTSDCSIPAIGPDCARAACLIMAWVLNVSKTPFLRKCELEDPNCWTVTIKRWRSKLAASHAKDPSYFVTATTQVVCLF